MIYMWRIRIYYFVSRTRRKKNIFCFLFLLVDFFFIHPSGVDSSLFGVIHPSMICICLRVCFVILFTCGPLSAPHSSSTNVTHGCICYVSHPVCLSAHMSTAAVKLTLLNSARKTSAYSVAPLLFLFISPQNYSRKARAGRDLLICSCLHPCWFRLFALVHFVQKAIWHNSVLIASRKGSDSIWGCLHNWLSNHLIICSCHVHFKKRSILSVHAFCK